MEITLSENRHKQLVKILKAIQKRVDEQILLNKDILDSKEACTYLNISESMLYKLTSDNKIAFSKPNGKKLYFIKRDLDEWSKRNYSKGILELEKEAEEIYYEHFKNNGHGR